ncbi:SPFH/Band 7/PHB domain protein [bacterium]|jgi:regulator of protease activity HflC (stomatin/prohibitin superfamily)|nr:SPFH/Band 7/PHB domain protein [bacterium]MBT3903999.1 SPFH/Band 7/PHB domain protein [bacterium]MBT4577661.1 SPFH/Band 7/PHB domain protein [bacterium]MBT5345627.1 SPFH/Band 7/PHB domain protein [bacterium]MBT6130686.1 SPFH/Band 7/PHB domain protein [bacterium]
MILLQLAILVAVGSLALLILLSQSIYLVRQAEAVVIEHFGRYSRTLRPGLHFIVPFLETARRVTWVYVGSDGGRYYRYARVLSRIDLRETVYDFPRQNVITKDNVTMEINALLYYQITDPKAAVYEVCNLPEAIEQLTQTTLRDVIGSLDLDETLVSRGQINERLRIILDEATDKWGVKINRVELKEVNPPDDIRLAMEKQMRAERDRRAMILEAEGHKRATILEAEGEKESQVLRAHGQAEARVSMAEGEAVARLKIAQAEAQSIANIKKVHPEGDPLAYMTALHYFKSMPEMMKGKNDKLIIVPYEASAMVGSVATIKKLFDQVSE